ncbi:putative cysteine protease atg4 [Zancudomyces culisetae]|uniref:Cysteine protease n=1 Tax=Zancudomyces culisetae TaxID=1213189 RepID=A0A1R1PEF7_ZANCU|nr:putative cysteine protease atg4 [Zancudomyces culisetae]|eukprot:OMH79309.1 putative cysteine protease atg4 [Zancudomyces culisetae]
MAQAGKSQGKHAGEWYGPFGTANVLKQLADSDPKFSPRTYVTSDGIIQVQDLVTLEEGVTMEELFKRQPEQKMKMEPTLILVATRLGIDRVNPIYFRFIKTCLSSKLCVGIAGGKPSSALYFIGFEGDDLVYLDPHFNKPKINRRNSYSEYNSADVASYRCSEMKKTHISRIDPCMFVGFYIDSVDSLLSLYLTLKPFESVVILSTEPPVCEVGAGTSVDDLGVLSGGDDDSF